MLKQTSRLIERSLRQTTAQNVARRLFSSLNTFSEEETLFRSAVQHFAHNEIAPHVKKMDQNAKMEPSIIKGLFENGFMACELEEEYGGSGGSFTSAIICIEELAKVDAAVSVLCDVQNTLVITAFRQWASDELKSQWLPRLACDTVGAFCLSEASSGSDAFSLKTTAKPQDDGSFLLNGSKLWITNGAEAGMLLVFANEAPEKGYKGISAFVVPADAPGVEIGKKEDKLGIRASSTTPIHFTNVHVPREQVFGQRGLGYKYAIEILNEGRIGIGAQMLGIAEGAFESTLPYLYERKQFNQFIGDFQAMQYEVADVALKIEASRLLVYNAARLKEEGKPFVKEAAMAKLHAAQAAELAASKAIEWCGGVGITKEFPQEKYFRDMKIGSIYEGTSLIQRTTIAKILKQELLGK